jgi:polyisoprenoid-binding protein YceI
MVRRIGRSVGMSVLTIAGLSALGFTKTNAPTAPLPTVRADTTRWVVAAEGNEARYRVREQLANLDFPSDAVGATKKVEGTIMMDGGKIVGSASKITVDLTSLATDSNMRDNYVRRRTLITDSFPTAVLVPRELHGLPSPLPPTGEMTFQLIGDLTVHGVTKQVTWDVTAKMDGSAVTGTATTNLKFDDFSMSKPRVARVLSVEDDIRLEYDFRLVPAN